MATAATSLLGLALPVTGELSGTWGDTVNVSITALLDSAVAGTTTLSSDADVTLTTTTLAANQARQAIILWTAGGTVTRTITAPAQSKAYIVINKTSSSQSIKIVGAGPTTGVTIVAGTAAFVVWNGVDFVTASVTSTTGVLPVANGGTGLSSGTSGGVLAYTATGTLASSAALAANALVIGGGAGAAPSTTTTGTGVVTALGVNTGTAGAFVVNGGALGTPSSGTVTNLTGTASININGTVGATTATTGAFTSLTASTTLGVTGVSTLTAGAVIQGLTVGLGAGAVATNTAVGASALAANTTGDRNVAVGDSALATNSSGILNTAIGYQAAQLNSTGNDITAVGFTALKRVTAVQNTAVGSRCAPFLTSGQYNVGVGDFVLSVASTSSSNTAIGSQTLSSTTTSGNSTAVGYAAGNLSTGIGNQFFGYNSGSAVTTGAKNVILGSYTGSAAPISATGSNNIVLSDGDGVVRQVIDSSGNVGIGTASPAGRLHAFGNVGDMLRLDRDNTGAVGNQIAFRHSNAGTPTETAAINAVSTANADTGTLTFYTKPTGGSNTLRMTLDSSGNVGIGTTSITDFSGRILAINAASGAARIKLTTATSGTTSGDGGGIVYDTSNFLTIINRESDGIINFSTQAIERARFNSTGAFIFAGGTTTADGIGITFPATQSASTNANTLDDYEEGTWTPNQGAGLTVVGTFSSTGNYVKVGKMVTVQVSLAATTSITISASDAIMFTNLPFASSPTRNPGVAVNTAHQAGLFVNISSTTVYSCGTLVASATIFLSITYQTS